MRNRAKCKLCKTIIESFHETDYVHCQCGEIAISGGLYHLWTEAKDYSNFLRIEEDGRETSVRHSDADKPSGDQPEAPPLITPRSMLNELKFRIEADESLPEKAQLLPITNLDQRYYMLLIHATLDSILKKIGE